MNAHLWAEALDRDAHGARQPKIRELHAVVLNVQQHVLGLQVPVDHPASVEAVQRTSIVGFMDADVHRFQHHVLWLQMEK